MWELHVRFNLGEVWKPVGETGLGRAVVVSIAEEGRRGRLYFENTEDEQWFGWTELTQAGKWHLDASPKPLRDAAELKAMILQKIRSHPVCPEGMSVEIAPKNGVEWEALAVPPPGQSIAYKDCAHYISTVAVRLRALFGIRLTQVVSDTGVPTGWLNSGSDADYVAHQTAERQRRFVAAQVGPSDVPMPMPPLPSRTIELEGIRPGVALDKSVTYASTSSIVAGRLIANRLAERPAEIGAMARNLSEAIADQIAQLNASKPNDAERLAQQNEFVAFLESLASGLDDLGSTLEKAANPQSPQPVLRGRAAEIASQLGAVAKEGLERNRDFIADCAIKFTVFAAGFLFLNAIGVDGRIAGFVAALMNVKLSKDGEGKK
jgi:hypothetical protein